MENQKLKEYFRFDDADLQDNRSGHFSARQNDRLFGRHNSAVREKRIAAAILIPLSVFMLGWMAYLIYKAVVGASSADIGAILPLGIFGPLFLLAGSYILRISFIGPTYLLKSARGPVNIVRQSQLTDNGMSVRYELHVGEEVFNLHLDATVGEFMRQGDDYAIYYSQGIENNLREILSVELVSKPTV